MPIKLTNVIIVTRVIPGMHSFRYTPKIISRGENPIASLASIRPASTSERTDSIWRAKNGTVPKTSATKDPVTPDPVPTNRRESGIKSTIKMMKGIERMMSIKRSKTVKRTRCSKIPPGRVVTKRTPTAIPRIQAMVPETPIIVAVCSTERRNSPPSRSKFGNKS